MAEKRLYDFLKSFGLGMNSYEDPLDLPKSQLSYLLNGTVRGRFANQRPCFNNLSLSFSSPAVQAAFSPSTGPFQAALFFDELSGTDAIAIAIGGQLFQAVPDTQGGCLVSQVALPDAGNQTGLVKQEMWQSERWLIWNDGVALPMFYDGVTARRSVGNSTTPLGTTANAYTVPGANQQLQIQLNLAYNGPIGVPILINAAQYFVVSYQTTQTSNPYYAVIFGVIQESTGADMIAPGTGFTADNQYVGSIQSATLSPAGTAITQWPGQPTSAGQFAVAFTNPINITSSPSPGVGATVVIGGVSSKVLSTSISQNGANIFLNSFTATPLSDSSYNIPIAGAVVYGGYQLAAAGGYSASGTNGSNYPHATVANAFTLKLSNPFKGSIGDELQVGAALMTVTGFNGVSVTCQMANNQVGQNIPFTAAGAVAANLNAVVVDISASGALTVVCTYPLTNGATPPVNNTALLVQAGMNPTINPSTTPPTVGQIVTVKNNGGTFDILQVTAVAASGAGMTGFWLTVENINDTPGNTVSAGSVIYPLPELPAGLMGVYGLGRNWMCLPDGRSFLAGDIVDGSSGSPAYGGTDAVLKVSENTYLAGGGNFKVPGNVGNITGMIFSAQLDVSLGLGPLQIFTQKDVFGCNAPVDRTQWQSLTNPILTEALVGAGGVGSDAITAVNGDIQFVSQDGNMRSLLLARLDFNRWGNTPISNEMSRLIGVEGKSLLNWCSEVDFDNRTLTTANPQQCPAGVYFTSLLAINLDPVSSMNNKSQSVWDGEWQGLNALKLIVGTFNGIERCFAVCLSSNLQNFEIHEILPDTNPDIFDNVNTPVTWGFESPSLFKDREGGPRLYKRLINGEFSINGIQSNIIYQVFYKTDQNPLWQLWYGSTIIFQGAADPGYRRRIPLGFPNPNVFDRTNNEPLREGYNFQVKFVFTGSCTFTEGNFMADVIDQPEFGRVT